MIGSEGELWSVAWPTPRRAEINRTPESGGPRGHLRRIAQHGLQHGTQPLLEPLLELAGALAADAELRAQLTQSNGFFRQQPFLEDQPLAPLQGADQLVELPPDRKL